jgi:hypothetical protein
VSVFRDRVESPFRATSTSLAWGSFAWFETEPDQLLFLRDGRRLQPVSLAGLLRAKRDPE